jgi:NADH:ubiquinone oxidoreductase subunit 3 (subunit A)
VVKKMTEYIEKKQKEEIKEEQSKERMLFIGMILFIASYMAWVSGLSFRLRFRNEMISEPIFVNILIYIGLILFAFFIAYIIICPIILRKRLIERLKKEPQKKEYEESSQKEVNEKMIMLSSSYAEIGLLFFISGYISIIIRVLLRIEDEFLLFIGFFLLLVSMIFQIISLIIIVKKMKEEKKIDFR